MSPEDKENRQLLAAIADGREDALRRFYERHHARIYRYALARLAEPADAADVVNDVMLQVWRGAASFRERSRVTTWLLGIAHHKVLDHLRRRGRHPTEELDERLPDDTTPDIESRLSAEQDFSRLHDCMEQLSPVQRQVLELTFFDDCSYPEVARIMGCPHGTVKTRVFHARKLLRDCLERLARGNEPGWGST